MSADEPERTSFDKSRAELFDALGHPVRISILIALEDGPLGFSELKRRVGLESSGHLQFHLGKLTGLIKSEADGSYSLTDDGKEALRIVGTDGGRSSGAGGGHDKIMGVPFHRILTVGLLVVLILISSVAVYQQVEIGGLNSSVSHLQQAASVGACGTIVPAGNFNISSSAQMVSSSGLGINLTVSSERIECGDTIYGDASLYNTLDHNLTIDVSPSAFSSLNDWAAHDAMPCGNGNAIIQLAVFDGYYTESNISKAGEPLQLGSPNETVGCIGMASPSGFVFMPQSGIGYLLYGGNTTSKGQAAVFSATLQHWACSWKSTVGGVESDCGTETGAHGYYAGTTATGSGFHLFHFGAYTLAASDVWGDTALVHFVVQ